MKIKVNGTELFFDVYGAKLNILDDTVIEKPTMIVLHGGHGFADHTLYVEFWSQFSEMVQVVFLDQRGCGRSDQATSEEWDLAHWGEDLFQFCKALDIKKPIIAGVSMGGHVMCEYIKQHPEHAGGLIFCNTEARFALDDVCDILRERGDAAAAEACYEQYTKPTEKSLQHYLKKCIPHYARNPYTHQEVGRCQGQLAVFQHYCKTQIRHLDYSAELKKIQCPTLLLAGEISPFHPPIRATEMTEMISSNLVELQIIKEAGAAVYKDEPEKSRQVVEQFLKQFIR